MKKCLMLMGKFLPVYVFCLHRPQLSKHKPNFKHFNSSLKINGIMLVLELGVQKGLSENLFPVFLMSFGTGWLQVPCLPCPTP